MLPCADTQLHALVTTIIGGSTQDVENKNRNRGTFAFGECRLA
jgi:hypothetical protein